MPTPTIQSQPSLTEGPIVKAITRLATPMLAGALMQNLQSVIDLFWVGRLGSTAVAAVAMSGTIIMVLFPLLMGLSTGTVALVARAIGANRKDEADAAAGQSLLLALAGGVLCGGVGWIASAPMFRLLGAEPDVLAAGNVYLRIVMAGAFTMFVLATGTAAMQGAGDALTPMWLMGMANVINIVLDPLMIFGLGPFPRMGVQGAAVATVISQVIAAGVALAILSRGRTTIHLRRHHWRPDRAMAWRILRVGIPGAGQMLFRSLINAVMMGLVATCGTAAVAAYGIGMRLHMIILMPAFALGGAAATLVGQNLGAGKPDRAYRCAWAATGIDLVIMAVSALLLALAAPAFIGVFNRDPEVIAIGARYLRIVSPFYLFTALGIVLGRALNGAGDSVRPMVFTLVSLWGVQVPLALLFARLWQPATHGIWWAMAIANTLHGLLCVAWFQLGRWKKAVV